MLPLYLVGLIAWLLIFNKGIDLWFESLKKGQWNKLKAGFAELELSSPEKVKDWFGEWELATETFLDSHLRTIAQLAAIAPLIGLLGTVSGMRATFGVITQFGFGNPAMLADGISESLLTTQSGLVIAFPIVLAHNYLKNKSNDILQKQRAWAFAWMREHKGVEVDE